MVTQWDKRENKVKRTHSLFVDDPFNLEKVDEIIVKASMETEACYGVKKCTGIVFRKDKMIKGERFTVSEDKMEALDPDKNEIYKSFGCKKADKTDVK